MEYLLYTIFESLTGLFDATMEPGALTIVTESETENRHENEEKEEEERDKDEVGFQHEKQTNMMEGKDQPVAGQEQWLKRNPNQKKTNKNRPHSGTNEAFV